MSVCKNNEKNVVRILAMSADTFALYEIEFHKTKHKLKNM